MFGSWASSSIHKASAVAPAAARASIPANFLQDSPSLLSQEMHLSNFSFSRLSLREMMRIRRPFPRRRRSIPSTPLLLLEVLMLPSVPAASAVLPALALVHGERINVVHHASITVRALYTHSPPQHHRSLNTRCEDTPHRR